MNSLFHGFPHLLHGGDYNPDQWLHEPSIIEEDFRLMEQSGCNTFTLGVFAWTRYEAEEGVYSFEWLDRIMDRMEEAGHQVILATPSGAKPAWMAKRYPETRRIDRLGLREPYQLRHNHCWTSHIFREKIRTLNAALAHRYAHHPALKLWHVSNELSGECFCPGCLSVWQKWLEKRYGELETLNRAWWTGFWSHHYTSWDEIDPRNEAVDGLRLDWKRFNTWQIADYFHWEAATLREITPHIPITTNFMGLHPGIDYARLSAEVDLVADDQYPFFDIEKSNIVDRVVRISFKNDLFRNFQPDRPWMLMECAPDWVQWAGNYRLKRPGVHQLEMFQALGHGAEGTLYFQWRKGRGAFEKFHSAVVDHEGSAKTRIFKQTEALSQLYARLHPILGSRPRQAKVALLFDWEIGWAMETSCGIPMTCEQYMECCQKYYTPLWEAGHAVDVLTTEALDLSGYQWVIAPQLFMLRPGVTQILRTFVQNGGTLLLTYNSGIVNESNLCFTGGWPGDGLQDICGIWNEEFETLDNNEYREIQATELLKSQQHEYRGTKFCAIVHSRDASVLARYNDAFYAGSPCLTRNTFGQGHVYYLAVDPEMDLLRALYAQIAEELHLNDFPFSVPKPRHVGFQIRETESHRFIFFQNVSDHATTIPLCSCRFFSLPEDANPGQTLHLKPWESTVLMEKVATPGDED